MGWRFIIFLVITIIFFSCGSSETKTSVTNKIDTLHYEEEVTTADTIRTKDSLPLAPASQVMTAEDSAGILLKARLAADSTSVMIADSVKDDLKDVRDYMRQKQNR